MQNGFASLGATRFLLPTSNCKYTLNCNISFFSHDCLIQDLLTKRIIGKGRESEGLYILETNVSKSVACSGVVTPFELHCRLGYSSLSIEEAISSVF